eukprot:scaffold1673_cov167-Chaetoceros_neogracile.AAC.10
MKLELESESDSEQFIASDPRHSPESSGLETVNLEEFASESPTIRIFVDRPREFLPLVSLFVEMSRAASVLRLHGYMKEINQIRTLNYPHETSTKDNKTRSKCEPAVNLFAWDAITLSGLDRSKADLHSNKKQERMIVYLFETILQLSLCPEHDVSSNPECVMCNGSFAE